MFKVGDIIKTSENEIGMVGWIENKAMNLKPEDGYIGIDLLTHSRGFRAPVSSESCTKGSINEVVEYYKKEIERLVSATYQNNINKEEIQGLNDENKYLKQLLKLYL